MAPRNLLAMEAPMLDQGNPLTAGAPSWADAYSFNAQAAQDWIDQQRAISAQRGLWGDQGMTAAGARDTGGQVANALLMGTTAPGFRAYHGSPHDFNAFDLSKIGTGEGAQAYGHGLYVAGNEAVARSYRDALAPTGRLNASGATGAEGMAARAMQGSSSAEEAAKSLDYNLSVHKAANGGQINPEFQAQVDEARRIIMQPNARGRMYEVQVNADPAHFLDWDKPISQQSQATQDRLSTLMQAHKVPRVNNAGGETTGGQLYNHLYDRFGGDAAAVAQELHGEGIPGIRYLDAGSRGAGEGTHNHVIFDANTIEILRKYGIAGLIAGGAAAGATANPSQ